MNIKLGIQGNRNN